MLIGQEKGSLGIFQFYRSVLVSDSGVPWRFGFICRDKMPGSLAAIYDSLDKNKIR